jgi:hypothetical protein
MPFARPRLLAFGRIPPPPLLRPRLALPPPVSLIPRWLRVEPLASLDVVRPPVSSSVDRLVSPERMFSVHSPIWSLRFESWLLIWLRFDHRNRPAAAAPTAAAAAATGRSRAISITPQSLYWLRPLGLLFRPPRLLLLGIDSSSDKSFALNPIKRLKASAVRHLRGIQR